MTTSKPALEKVTPVFGASYNYQHYDGPSQNTQPFWHFHPELELVYVNGGNGKRHIGKTGAVELRCIARDGVVQRFDAAFAHRHDNRCGNNTLGHGPGGEAIGLAGFEAVLLMNDFTIAQYHQPQCLAVLEEGIQGLYLLTGLGCL